jgi:hypothetical protein
VPRDHRVAHNRANARRRARALAAEPLTLHTVQPAAAVARMDATGVLRADERSADPEFLAAYRWMAAELAARVPGATGALPVWAWVWAPRRPLREQWWIDAAVQPGAVLLTCRVPRARVLLSDFDAWHCVLNGWYCAGEDPAAEAAWERVWDGLGARDRAAQPVEHPALRDMVVQSWSRVFELDRYPASDVQACVEAIRAHEVISRRVLLPRPWHLGTGSVREVRRSLADAHATRTTRGQAPGRAGR